MEYTVYVIQNESGKWYIGQTSNLEFRLKRHNQKMPNKRGSYTRKQGGIWKVAYKEIYPDRSSALKREKELKSHQGREFIKKVIQNTGANW